MKRFPIKAISILLVVAMLAVSSLPTKPLLAAEAQREVSSDKVASSAEQELAEAEKARALALNAGDVQRMQKAAAKEGLYLDTNQYPLALIPAEQGQHFYVSGSQAIVFLGEVKGQRLYEVALGFEEAANTQLLDRLMKRPIIKKPSVRSKDSLMLMIVDTLSQSVVHIRQLDLYNMDKQDGRSIVMRRPDGSRSRYLETKDGWQQETTEDGVTRQETILSKQLQCQTKAPGLMRETPKYNNLTQRDVTVCTVVCAAVTSLVCVLAFVTIFGAVVCGVAMSIFCGEYCTTYP